MAQEALEVVNAGETDPAIPLETGHTVEQKNGMYLAPMGDGTLLDNFLILQVKEGKFREHPDKLAAVQKEMDEYRPAVDDLMHQHPDLEPLCDSLSDIHRKLWYIEDRKREIERAEDEDTMIARLRQSGNEELLHEYLKLSRQVSLFNDQRAQIKRKMNAITGSAIVEVKSHRTVAEE